MDKVQPGQRYRHYKCNTYKVLYLATHTETEEKLVVYQAEGKSQVWVRPYDMFVESVNVEGQTVPRFTLLDA
jgi:hypothetical protein